MCGGEVGALSDGVACSNCWNATKIFTGNETLCGKCGAFLFDGSAPQATFCGKCEDQDFDLGIAVGLYEKALAASVLSLKKNPSVSGRTKSLLKETANRISDRADLVVPIPLSPRRLHERGFNQAALIGKVISRHLGVELDEATLIRQVDTPMHRAGMDRKARGMTVKNAFAVSRPKLVDGKNILLADDVLTSGETVSSCAKVLKKFGAARVDVITLARAV